MHALPARSPPSSKFNIMDHDNRIDLALAELDNSDAPNIAAIAAKHNLDRSTLSRRFRGVTHSRRQFISNSKKPLTDSQEAILIEYINWNASRGLYFTPRLLQTVVEHYLDRQINRNWTSEFFSRHTSKIQGYILGDSIDLDTQLNLKLIQHISLIMRVILSSFLRTILIYI
jgi:hypothetical protein